MRDFFIVSGTLVITIIILILFLLGLGLIHLNFDSEGTHTGYVTAVERRGVFVQNYQVYFKTNKQQSQEDTYCVRQEDVSLAEELRKTGEEDKEITIKYTGEKGLSYHLCRYDRIISFEIK